MNVQFLNHILVRPVSPFSLPPSPVSSFDFVPPRSFLCFCSVLSPCVSFYVLLFPPPPIPRSVSCGLNVAPAHTSARHEAVRVWLESMSGGSTDFNKKGRQRPDLDSMLLPDCLLPFPLDACRNTCRGQCTHKHACCKAVAGPRVLFFRGQVNTHVSPFTSLLLLQSCLTCIYLFFTHTLLYFN